MVLFADKPSWVVDLRQVALKTHRRLPKRDPENPQTRCPIYRALSPEARLDLEMRMPGIWNPKSSLIDDMFMTARDGCKRSPVGGVSPLTAMGLLVPGVWAVLGRGRVSPQVVIPEPISYPDPETGKSTRRRTERWHVCVWAFKCYCPVSWSEITSMACDLNRTPSSLRQTVRRSVEEPLAGFFLSLTGQELDPVHYSSALVDDGSDPEMKERMRILKKHAHRRRKRQDV